MTQEAKKRADEIEVELEIIRRVEALQKENRFYEFRYVGWSMDNGFGLGSKISNFMKPVFEAFVCQYKEQLLSEFDKL